MSKLAFCGLGQMGIAMATRLVEFGHDVTVWNRTPSKAEPLTARGAGRADFPAEAAVDAEAVVTMLADPSALEEVVFGERGLAASMSSGSTLIEMSTVGPDAVRQMASRMPAGVEVLDAPVRGSIPQAADGTLVILVGGPEEAYRRWEPVLRVLGEPVHAGPLGAGAAMKLVANMTLGVAITAVGEALALAKVHDLDPATVLDMLSQTPLGRMVEQVRPKLEGGEFPLHFRLALAHKDLRLVSDAAEAAGLDARLSVAARDWMGAAESAGWGDSDYSSVTAFILEQVASSARHRES